MSDRIEVVLLHTLEQAKGAVQIAKDALDKAEKEHASRQRDVDNCKALLAHHRRLTAAEPLTEVFPAVTNRSADGREAEIRRRSAPWLTLIDQHVTLTDKDGILTGLLLGVSVDVIKLGTVQGEAIVPTENVLEIVPAVPVDSHPTGAHQLPDPAVTLTDPPVTRPDCPGCDGYARSPEGCPEHGHDYAEDGADHA